MTIRHPMTPTIRFTDRHPVTGRAPFHHERWCAVDGVVFVITADSEHPDIWVIQPDIETLSLGLKALAFVESEAYWCAVTVGLEAARRRLAAFVASDRFAPLRAAYRAVPGR